jgi:hypothetical protein
MEGNWLTIIRLKSDSAGWAAYFAGWAAYFTGWAAYFTGWATYFTGWAAYFAGWATYFARCAAYFTGWATWFAGPRFASTADHAETQYGAYTRGWESARSSATSTL